MFRTIAVSAALVVLASTVPAMAADETTATPAITVTADRVVEAAVAPDLETPYAVLQPLQATSGPSRGGLLPSLYVSLAGLNAYDALSTLKGMSRGAVETNAVMSGVAGSPVALIAVKTGITAGSILMAEHFWKSGHKAHAIGMMVASNAMMVFVGARNSHVLGVQR